MANLSQDDLTVIAKYPLDGSLDNLQDSLGQVEQSCEPSLITYDGPVDSSDQVSLKTISKLLYILLGQDAALNLRSKTGQGDLTSELYTLFKRVRNGDFNYEQYRALSRLVIKKAPDVDIWNSVFDLVSAVSRITPPPPRPSFTSSFQQTPWSFNTGSVADTSEHRNQVDEALKEELTSSLRFDIPDFVHAVFGQVPQLDELAERVFDECQTGETPLFQQGSGWTKWPPSAKEELVLEWLQDLMKRLVRWVNDRDPRSIICRYLYQGPTVYLDGSPIKRKMDVGITTRYAPSKSQDYGIDKKSNISISNWSEILVAGELKSNAVLDGQNPAWLNLATYAREVFRVQDRRFVLGFTLCGSIMRLWQFDRSGSSGSSSFNINEDGFKFVYIMLGYLMMNDEQLGLDPTIRQSDGKFYMEVTRNDKTERLILTNLIRKQAVIAGRATTCWKAYRDGDESKEPLLVKDSWQYEERPEEGELIKEATDKMVRNIARYYHHETVQVDGKNDDISENVRKGLMKKCGRTKFIEKSSISSEASASESFGRALAGRTQSGSASRKRSSSPTRMAPPPAKRSCSSLEARNSRTPTNNRIRRRVITRDVGKTIQEASSLVAVLNGLVGAINGHESLLDAGILHRDISIGNIMLTEGEDNGFVIDLDLAIKTDNIKASGAPSKTGTKVFMAIGALLGEHHNFMHDLESFFWVLFWICIHWDGPGKKRRETDFEDWNYLPVENLATQKTGRVSKRLFDMVTDKFTSYCKPLVNCIKELHKVVFPEGVARLEQDRGLYNQMRSVLEKAREDPAVVAIV